MKYRAEIDGLRALAVLPVILFHAGLETFAGGFVGVDVFFVISGYLITSIILADRERGISSLLYFYERRARRILPALTVVMLTCIPFAWVLLAPADVREFAKALVYTSIFASNVLFARQTGYFDADAELNPLLHTWSLAVEEQYYLLFPILMIACRRVTGFRLIALLGAVAALSLAYAHYKSGVDPQKAFFLLPTRIWELLLGAMLSVYYFGNAGAQRGVISGSAASIGQQTCALAGVALILVAIFTFDKSIPYPSTYALVPTIGTVLIIAFGGPATVVGRMLTLRPIVGLGLISYSAYLWHQPLFAFARHASQTEPSAFALLALTLIAFCLAYVTWRFVEQPFRRANFMNNRQLLACGSAAGAFFLSCGVVLPVFHEQRFLAHLPEQHRGIYKGLTDRESRRRYENGECHFQAGNLGASILQRFDECFAKHGPAIVVIGDSHAANLYRSISYSLMAPFVFSFSRGGCRLHTPSANCQHDAFKTFLEQHREKLRRVVYTQAGFYLIKDDKGSVGNRRFFNHTSVPVYKVNLDYVQRVADYLSSLSHLADIVWLGPRIEPHIKMQHLFDLSAHCDIRKISVQPNILHTFVRLDDEIQKFMSAGRKPRYVSQAKILGFDAGVDLYDCSNVYWSDGDHWSEAGERRFGKIVSEILLSDISAGASGRR